ncbi:hypothetical protein GOV14_06340 [Candidatus Pacearchaeota archaeon]|nr:hypothetical protein [Candidatus Pacearchaeota archaeon]
MNILFICKYNRFRSRIAAEYFKKINKNKNIKVKSAGVIKGDKVDGYGVGASKRLWGINIKGRPKTMSSKLLGNTDLAIIVANDVPKSLLTEKINPKNIQVWNLSDTDDNKKRVDNLINKIVKKTKDLVKELENAK